MKPYSKSVGLPGRMSRRQCIGMLAALPSLRAAGRKVVVAGHPWVYAAKRPRNDIFEILDQIFADMSAAGLDAIELMHTALLPDSAVARLREISKRNRLPVLGTSFGGNMCRCHGPGVAAFSSSRSRSIVTPRPSVVPCRPA